MGEKKSLKAKYGLQGKLIGCVLMWVVFFILHAALNSGSQSAIIGGLVAMGVAGAVVAYFC